MKFSVLSCLVAGAAFVSATPMRVVLVSSGQENSPNLRFGHAMGSIGPVLHAESSANHTVDNRRGCSRFHQKAIEFSNTFRQALGLPIIETKFKSKDGQLHGGAIRIMPFIGTPPVAVELIGAEGKTRGGEKVEFAHPVRVHHHHHGHGPMFHHRLHRESFLRRLHVALMTLGPWEGRAIAFVLGCGLGVLLRMMWVLVVVSYRAIRGNSEDDNEYIAVPNQYDAEEIFVAPPQYFVDDEKTPIEENSDKN
ncbi:hypothetical protein D9758_003273 [Tetrapyrgos nigripes]|uniref:Uncharacterized protein n=1 Tax=Tetrapyrgos nigripes TaxID=182062 RepID=A0A8H5GJ47_9AGAR|nr:hypothetical protein D9758_003273 [Tetrapyrgos nigripes]